MSIRTRLLLLLLFVLPATLHAQYAGNALYLDFANSYAEISDPDPFVSVDSYTFEAWVYVNAYTINVIAGVDEGGDYELQWLFGIGSVDGNSLRLMITDGSTVISSTKSVTYGAWNHVAVTSDGTFTNFYINGVAAGEDFVDDPIAIFDADNVVIGTAPNDAETALVGHALPEGRFDNLRFWTSARTATQLKAGMTSTPTHTRDLAASYTFETTDGIVLKNAAKLELSVVPSFNIPSGYTEDLALASGGSSQARSSILTISAPNLATTDTSFTSGEYVLAGHTLNDLKTTTDVWSLGGVAKRLEVVWSLRMIEERGVNLSFDIPSTLGIDSSKAVILTSTSSDFTEDVQILIGNSSSGLVSQLFPDSDTVYVTVGELENNPPSVTGSLGFGPFVQGNDNLNAFTALSLPSGTSEVKFLIMKGDGVTPLDSNIVTGSDLSRATYEHQMGKLPVGASLRVEISGSSSVEKMVYIEEIAITASSPSITSSDGFEGYVVGTTRTTTFEVDSLPEQTTAVTFRIVDVNGNVVQYINTSDVVTTDSMRVEGSDLSSAEWTVNMKDLELPLSAQLEVTVEHEGGVPGGITYTVSLQILAAPLSLLTTNGWGPYVTNGYTLASNNDDPWESVSSQSTTFAVDPVPPRTTKVIFQVVDAAGLVYKADTITAGLEWLSSAETSSIVLSDISPLADSVQAIVYTQGGPAAGIIVRHAIDIAPQSPRIFLDPSNYDPVVNNPAISSQQKSTTVTVEVEPSTASTDSVVIQVIDEKGGTLLSESAVPQLVGGVMTALFTLNMADLPYTADSIVALSYSSVSSDPAQTAVALTLDPGKPEVTTFTPIDTYTVPFDFTQHFELSAFPESIESVTARLINTTTSDTVVSETFTSNSLPYSHSMEFNGTDEWFRYWSYSDSIKEFSLVGWFRTTGTGMPIIGYNDGSGDAYYPILYINGDGRLTFTRFGSSAAGDEVTTEHKLNDGEWHHFAAVLRRGSSDSGMVLFVDGGLAGRTTALSSNTDLADLTVGFHYFMVGKGALTPTTSFSQSTSTFFEGEMTAISYWGGNLNVDQITELMFADKEDILALPWISNYLSAIIPLNDTNVSAGGFQGDRENDVIDSDINPRFHLNGSLKKVVLPVNFDLPIADVNSSYELNVSLIYPDSPPLGRSYSWPLDIEWNSGGLHLTSDAGFGPFVEGSKAETNFEFTYSDQFDDDWYVYLLDANDTPLIAVGPQQLNTKKFSIDMGSARPGSTLLVQVKAGSTLKTESRYSLAVSPLVPPTIAGHTGPFIQAIAPGSMAVNNTFTITSYADDISLIRGTFYDASWTKLDDVTATMLDDTTWTLTQNMAALSPPHSYMVVDFYLGTSSIPAVRDTVTISITRTRPDWLASNTAFSSVSETDSTVNFTVTTLFVSSPNVQKVTTGNSTTYSLSTHVAPNGTPIIGGDSLNAAVPQIVTSLLYNKETKRLSLVGDVTAEFQSYMSSSTVGTTETLEGATHDGNNNLLVNNTITWSATPSNFISAALNMKEILTLAGEDEEDLEEASPVSVEFAIRPNFQIEAGSRLYTGEVDGKWGAIGNLDLDGDEDSSASHEYTQFAIGISIEAGISVLWGVASAVFELTARGLVGSGVSYKSVPNYQTESLQSYGFQLYGELNMKELWGLLVETVWGPDMFYHHQWGDKIPELWPEGDDGWIWGGTERDNDPKGSAVAGDIVGGIQHPSSASPRLHSQPSTSSDGEGETVVRMEQDQLTGRGTLTLETLRDGAFAGSIIVTSNANAIAHPRVANLSDHLHLVTWSQSRYTRKSLPYDPSARDLVQSLDLWYALVNSETGVVEQTGILEDDFSGAQSGRMEGNADVARLSEESGLMTWIVADPAKETSTIYSVTISKENGMWVASTPTEVSGISGVNH
ncbi:MAG: LamG-like jellyroll fold domain-containing protein, partial [Candidatus Kapaibacterium sp.]